MCRAASADERIEILFVEEEWPKAERGYIWLQVVAAAAAEYVYLPWIVRNVHDFCNAFFVCVLEVGSHVSK